MRRLRQILADLEHLVDAVGRIVTQTRQRAAGEIPPAKTRLVSLSDSDARPIRKGSLAQPTQFGYTGQVTDNRQGIIVDYEIQPGMPPDAPRLAPAIHRAITATGVVPEAVTADRGYGQTSVDTDLDALGVALVAVLRKGKTSQATTGDRRPPPTSLNSSNGGPAPKAASPPSNAKTAGTGPAPEDCDGARTWCGWGVFAHNAPKTAALTN